MFHEIELFKCLIDITIGNGAGKFSFVMNRRYTRQDLNSAHLAPGQIKKFFEARKVRA